MQIERELLSEPDSLGRVLYIDRGLDPLRPYCGACGACASRECEHYGTENYARSGQVFHCVPRPLPGTTR